MKATVKWQGRMTFTGVTGSGFPVTMGTDRSVGGDNDGAGPLELLAIGLAGCTSMDVISILAKKRQEVTDYEIETSFSRAENYPKVFTGAVMEYFIVGHSLDEAAVVRAIELSLTRYCPAYAMFSKIMPFEVKYHIYEDEGDGERRLVKSAMLIPVLNPISE